MPSKDADGQDGAEPEMDVAPSVVGPAGARKKVAELLSRVAALLERHEAVEQGRDDLQATLRATKHMEPRGKLPADYLEKSKHLDQESESIQRDTVSLLHLLGRAFAACRTWHSSELGSLHGQMGKVVDTYRPTDDDGNRLYRRFAVRPILDKAYALLSEADRALRALPDKPASRDDAGAPASVVGRRERGTGLEVSRARVETLKKLHGELAGIVLDVNQAALTAPDELKPLNPDFELWSLVSPEDLWTRLISEKRFNVKEYAGILTCKKYNLTSPETLKKDRQRVRRAGAG